MSLRTVGIAVASLNQFTGNTFLKEMRQTVTVNDTPLKSEDIMNGGVHPVTEEAITKYKQLIDDPLTREVWSKVMCEELGRLSQGYDKEGSPYHTEDTNSIGFLDHEGIGKILRD